MKKFLSILKIAALILWQLPQILVALVMIPFLGKMTYIKKINDAWVFSCKNMRGAISLGCFIFLSEISAKKEATIQHEAGHVKQSHMLGWLYLFVIGIPSICWAAFGSSDKCYYSFYTERWANKLGGVKVAYTPSGKCFTYLP